MCRILLVLLSLITPNIYGAWLLPVKENRAFMEFQNESMDSVMKELSRKKPDFSRLRQILSRKKNLPARHLLSIMLIRGIGGAVDRQRGFEILSRTANQGFVPSQLYLGLQMEEGGILHRDIQGAFHYLKSAGRQGNEDAILALARLLELGDGIEKNEKGAFELIFLLSSRQNAAAIHQLARLYFHGIGTRRDIRTAYTKLREAANLGYVPSIIMLGVLAKEGAFGTASKKEAMGYFEKAFGMKDPRAGYELALMFLMEAHGNKKAGEKALSILRALSEAGYAPATDLVSMAYREGIGTRQSRLFSFLWHKAALRQAGLEVPAKNWGKNIKLDSIEKRVLGSLQEKPRRVLYSEEAQEKDFKTMHSEGVAKGSLKINESQQELDVAKYTPREQSPFAKHVLAQLELLEQFQNFPLRFRIRAYWNHYLLAAICREMGEGALFHRVLLDLEAKLISDARYLKRVLEKRKFRAMPDLRSIAQKENLLREIYSLLLKVSQWRLKDGEGERALKSLRTLCPTPGENGMSLLPELGEQLPICEKVRRLDEVVELQSPKGL